MKNSFLFHCATLLVAILFSLQANAQFNFYGTAADNENFRETEFLNGHYFATGNSNGQATLTKINATTQAHVWTKQYFAPAGETFNVYDIQVSHSGNLIIAGNTQNSAFWQFQQLMVIEINQNTGDILQSRHISLNNINGGDHRITSVRIVRVAPSPSVTGTLTCSPEYILKCNRANGGGAYDEMLIMKLDYSLNTIWANLYSDGAEWESYNVVATPSGGAVVCGITTTGIWYGYLLEVDAFGNVVANSGYRTTAGDAVYMTNIIRDYTASGTGNFIVTGGFRTGGVGNFIGHISKINSTTYAASGAGTWAKSFAKPSESVLFTGLTQFQLINGSIYTGYFTPDVNYGMMEPRVLRVNTTTGAFQGYRDFGGPNAGYSADQLRLTTNGTSKVSVTTGMVGNIGMNDAYQLLAPSNLSDACAGTTAQAAVNKPLSVTPLGITTTNVTADISSYALCSNAPLTWAQNVAPCQPYGHRPGAKTMKEPVISQSAELELYNTLLNNPTATIPSSGRTTKAALEVTNEQFEFEVTPNPASTSVQISFFGGEGNETSLQIFDLNGKLLKTEIVNDAEQTSLDISELPQGIYLLKTQSGSTQKLTKL